MTHGGSFLDSDDTLPALSFDTVGHGRLRTADLFEGQWGVLLVYRAHW